MNDGAADPELWTSLPVLGGGRVWTSRGLSSPVAESAGQVRPRLGEHGLTRCDLHPFTPLSLTEGLLRSLEPVITFPIREVHALGIEELDDRRLVRVHGFGERPGSLIGQDVPDRLQGITLRMPDESDGTALDPPGRVHAWNDVGLGGLALIIGVDDTALMIGNDPFDLVERQLRQLGARVPDRAVDGIDVPVVEVPEDPGARPRVASSS